MESWWWGRESRVEPIEDVKPDTKSQPANQQKPVSAVSASKQTKVGRSVSVYRSKSGATYATTTSSIKRKSSTVKSGLEKEPVLIKLAEEVVNEGAKTPPQTTSRFKHQV